MDELHGEKRPEVGKSPEFVHRHDSGVLELAGDLGLFDEAPDELGLFAVRFEQDLERQLSAEVGVASAQDGPHAAAGDLAEELVAIRLVRGPGRFLRERCRACASSISQTWFAEANVWDPIDRLADLCQNAREVVGH